MGHSLALINSLIIACILEACHLGLVVKRHQRQDFVFCQRAFLQVVNLHHCRHHDLHQSHHLEVLLVDDIKIVLEGEGHKVVLKGVAQLEILVHLVSLVVFSSFVVTVTLALVLLLADVDALEEVEEGIALDYHRLLLGALALLLLGVGHVAARQPRDGVPTQPSITFCWLILKVFFSVVSLK